MAPGAMVTSYGSTPEGCRILILAAWTQLLRRKAATESRPVSMQLSSEPSTRRPNRLTCGSGCGRKVEWLTRSGSRLSSGVAVYGIHDGLATTTVGWWEEV